jgi:hypothetical protein
MALAQQSGELDNPGLVEAIRLAGDVEDGVEGVLGHASDGGAFSTTELPADGVVHSVSGSGVERGDVVDQAVRGAGTVHGDQQVAAIPGRDAGNRLVEHLDLITYGVRAGAARAHTNASDSPVLSHQAING